MHIEIDRNACQGNALCVGIAPELFDVDDDGLAVVLRAEVPGDLEDVARDASRSCPTRAIGLSDSASDDMVD